MKYKKQLRWLLLMIIPFVIILAIHFIIPLSIVGSCQPFAANNYLLLGVNLWENVAQYNSMATTSIIQDILHRYMSAINIFNNFTLSYNNPTRLTSPPSINSAYLFNSQVQNSSDQWNIVKDQSMWFAANITNPNKLTPSLKAIYDRYLTFELYLRALLRNSIDSTLKSVSVRYVSPSNQSIVFEYPTRYNPIYLTMNTSVQEFIDTKIFSGYANSSINSVAFIEERPQLKKRLLVICKPTSVNGIAMAPCIHLDIDLLGNDILRSINMTGPNFFRTYVVTGMSQMDIRSNKTPQTVLLLQNGNKIVTKFNDTLNLTNTGVKSDYFPITSLIPSEILLVGKIRNLTSYISSISSFNKNISTIILRVYTQSLPQVLSNIRTVNILGNLKAMLIPNGILILIGSFVSALVLKVLFDSLEKELFELDNRCQFIVDGDINIQIAEHKGTADIRKVYDQVRIINKIHRCSTSSYFSGHFAEKLLKYNEALQFLTSLNYDTGNILENMGEVATHLEQWDKAIGYYSKCIEMGLRQMRERFNLTMNDVLRLKRQKQTLPHAFRQFQTIMIRRLFKLNFTYVKYIELRLTFTKIDKAQKTDQQVFKGRMNKMVQQCFQNLRLLKICFYPDFWSYSESIITLLCEAKQLANLKRFEQSRRMLDIVANFSKAYTEEYPQVKQKLKESGSKFKLFRLKNKLTPHSRLHPQVMKSLNNLFEAKILALSTESYDKLNMIAELLLDATKTAYVSLNFGYMVVLQLRKLLISLKIDPTKFESTQIFKQVSPFKTLYYGQPTHDTQAQLLKFPTSTSSGLERQFVFLVDCAKNDSKSQIEFYQNKANYIYDKLIKQTDRLSIIKFNLKHGIKIQCNLTLKESNEEILKKEINACFKQPLQIKGCLEQIVEGLYRTVNRIKALQCEKIIVMFFRSIAYYTRLNEKKSKKKSEFFMDALTNEESVEGESAGDFGFHVIEALRAEQLRNCKLIIYCAKNDTVEQFRAFFGLDNINNELYNESSDRNNLLYIIEEKHKSDIDRILMQKTQDVPDNHIFIL